MDIQLVCIRLGVEQLGVWSHRTGKALSLQLISCAQRPGYAVPAHLRDTGELEIPSFRWIDRSGLGHDGRFVARASPVL